MNKILTKFDELEKPFLLSKKIIDNNEFNIFKNRTDIFTVIIL